MELIRAIREGAVGDVIAVYSSDKGSKVDIPKWVEKAGHGLLGVETATATTRSSSRSAARRERDRNPRCSASSSSAAAWAARSSPTSSSASSTARSGGATATVTVVDATGKHTYQPGFMYIAMGGERAAALERPERSLLDKRVYARRR